MNVLDLFSGIGGFSLGLERAGMRTVAFCEIDGWCRRVLAKHWPDAAIAEDITGREFQRGEADVICGGFPCQDISLAGEGAGLAGERSGLWRELLRAIRVVRPRYAIVENVAALLGRGMGTVLGDLATVGYDAEWHCIPACAVGAPHIRDRVWIIANPGSEQHEGGRPPLSGEIAAQFPQNILYADEAGSHAAAHAGIYRIEESPGPRHGQPERSDWWAAEPNVGRVAHGVPSRVDRLGGLGNAVVPKIPEIIGRAIMRTTTA